MSSTVRATAILDAKDQTGPAFAAAQARVKQLERNMERLSAVQNRAVRSSAIASAAIAKTGGSLSERLGSGGMLLAGRVGPALAGVGAGAYVAQSVKRYAEVERAMTRVAITGDATNEEIAAGIANMRKLADETAQPFDRMREGMEALTASGKSFQESLAMMPAIARTAQASGASMADTAKTSIALLNHMGIKADQIQLAQDIIAKGGKMGEFEAKDIAAAFPSLLPAANAVGFNGIEGLKHLVSIAQTIRTGTGTSGETATSLQNVLQKMEIEETAKKFQKFGVDLRKEMEEARKKGANLFDTFLDLTEKALKGDMSKLPQLFQDSEVLRGMRPLLTSRGKIAEFQRGLADAAGTTASDLARVLANKQADIDRFMQAWERLQTAVGKSIGGSSAGTFVTKKMNNIAENLERNETPQQSRERIDREIDQFVLDKELKQKAKEQSDLQGKILALRDRVAADPKFAERHDVAARANQFRNQMNAVNTRLTELRMPKLGAGGNMYDVPGALLVNRDPAVMEQMREFKRFNGGSKFPAVNAPLPPMRPGDLPQTGPMPALDFSAAVDSAKEAKDDIEAALRAIDLASAGVSAAGSFRNNFTSELKKAEADTDGFIARVTAKLDTRINSIVLFASGGLAPLAALLRV